MGHLDAMCCNSLHYNCMTLSDILTIETYSFGIPGLDSGILSRVMPEHGVVLAPVDPYFIFSPICLPGMSTRWAREYNLAPAGLHWYYWLPYDPPYDVFEWFPKWDTSTKKYRPLSVAGYPVKLPFRNVPEWVQTTKSIFTGMMMNSMEPSEYPPYVRESLIHGDQLI